MAQARLHDAVPLDSHTIPAIQSVQGLQFPRWIGQKFTPEGSILPFPGNTVICHVARDSTLFHALSKMYDSLKKQPFGSLYTLLPPTSWHMTVFEGVSFKMRGPGLWPADISQDIPVEDCTKIVRGKLEMFDLEDNSPFRMRIEGFEPLLDGIALKVVPADAEEEKRLRRLRDRVSDTLLVRHPGHDEYSFHISLSYMLRFLDGEQHRRIWGFLEEWRQQLPQTFELGAPEFCVFDDMFSFHRLFYLEKHY